MSDQMNGYLPMYDTFEDFKKEQNQIQQHLPSRMMSDRNELHNVEIIYRGARYQIVVPSIHATEPEG